MFPVMTPFPTRIQGNPGVNYKIVAGVLRNTAGVWGIYEDAIHKKINLQSVTSDASTITVNHSFVAKNICSFICVPDETYVKHGLNFGASAGTAFSIITPQINKTIGGYISYTGAAFDISNAPGVTSAVWSVDKLVITHEPLYQQAPNIYKASVDPRGGIYLPQLGGFGSTTVDVEFYNYTGVKVTAPDINMKIFFTRTAAGPVNPADLEITASNIWVYGIFEV